MPHITATVSVADVRASLGAQPSEERVLLALKSRFINRGIVFQDRPGLYPVPPCKVTAETLPNGFKVITIRQGVSGG